MRVDARLGKRVCRLANSKICWAALLSAVTSLACSNNPDTVRLEVYSWWGTPSEHEAFEEVLRIHRRRHKNVRVVNRAEQDSSETRRLMAAGLLAGAPPATFQTNIGASLLGWTMFDMQ